MFTSSFNPLCAPPDFVRSSLMALTLSTIPQELQIEILSNLDALSLSCCMSTCRSINETIWSSSHLIYIIQLHLDGLKDIETSSLGCAGRLNQLLLRRHAWGSTSPKLCAKLISLPDCVTYDLIDGVFASTDGFTLEMASLPTGTEELGTVTEMKLAGLLIWGLTLDPSQDVLVFLEDGASALPHSGPRKILVHIRSMSTHEIHPLASLSPFELYIHSDHVQVRTNIPFNIFLHLADNLLVLRFNIESRERDLPARVIMWDWTTSEVILDSAAATDPVLAALDCHNLGLLDSKSFFVTSPLNSGAIHLYRLVRPSNGESPCVPVHRAALQLPPLISTAKPFRIFTKSGPIQAHAPFNSPFVTNDEDRIHVFKPVYNSSQRTFPLSFNMFIPQRVFTKYMSLGSLENQGGPALNIPWKQWGPLNTCIIHPPGIFQLDKQCRYIRGQRIAFTGPGFEWDLEERKTCSSKLVVMLDFSIVGVLSARRTLPSSLSPMNHPGKLIPLCTIKASEVPLFEDDVEGALPCVYSVWDPEANVTTDNKCLIHPDGVINLLEVAKQGYVYIYSFAVSD
ncbi:hypothetical protein BDN70DRAFT_374723 [Pholiota conissans]|uniref:F-box domain-containing protein n=1 Tax=Pholiota conissans TaxID=109636 RepID=A0A9P5Z9B7_9AGAR|nr:hypothetical protein BDN70DRAFT_374723 [Pholiota conissans]